MFTKKEQIAARLILRSIHQRRKVIKADEIVEEMKESNENIFWGIASEAEKALSKFAAENLVVRIDENTYRILGDIASVRELVLRESSRETEEVVAAYDLDLEEITGSSWTLTGENQTDKKDDGGRDVEAEARNAYLQARRMELVRRMETEFGDDDDEETEEESDEEEEDEDNDMPPEVSSISQMIDEGSSIIKSDDDYFVVLKGFEMGGSEIRFKILIRDDGVYLSDEGLALLALNDRVSFDAEGIDEQIGYIVDRYHINVVGDDLRIKVDYPSAALSCMMRLYAAIERIITMDEEAIAVCAEQDKENDRIWDRVSDFLKADPDRDREAIVSCMKEGYRGVKDAGNYDDIILFARGVKEFTRMSDKDYLACRSFLLEHSKGQNEGKTERSGVPAAAETARTDKVLLPEEAENAAGVITETLAGFHIDSKIVDVSVGPTVMRFELDVPDNVARATVIERDAEFAMRLKQRDGIRVYADTERGRVFIEVPREIPRREKVRADELIDRENAQREKKNALVFALGENVKREFVRGDMARFGHILIGGADGSGKSAFLRTMIYSFITEYSPDDVRLLLCGAKEAEFEPYNKMPHLLTGRIATEAEQTVQTLRWAIKETERRHRLFEDKSAAGKRVKNIDEYNAARKEDEAKLPRLVIILDGYEDFVMAAKQDVEEAVRELAQKPLAAGIHLVVAAQCASDVAGLPKANFPTRIAFRMTREIDSRIILGEDGAEKLLGLGDMLMRCGSDLRCERIQGADVPQKTLVAAVAKSKKTYNAKFEEIAEGHIGCTDEDIFAEDGDDASNGSVSSLYIKALAIVVQEGSASISALHRKCHIGYDDAGKILNWMESMGYLSPFDQTTKARTVLLTKEEFIEKYGPIDE